MAIELFNAGALPIEWTTWFFYGRMGAGKTHALGTFPRPFIIHPFQEGSVNTLRGRHDVDFVLVHGQDEATETLHYLEDRLKSAREWWRKPGEDEQARGDELFPWQTVALESTGHYCDLIEEELTRGNQLDMDRQKWGKLSSHMRTLFTRLRALPCHLIFVDLVKESFDDKGKLASAGPSFPGKMSYRLPSACDSIVFFECAPANPNDIFSAYFRPQSKYVARTRFEALKKTGKLTPFRFPEVAKLLGI